MGRDQGCQVWPFRGQKMTNLVFFYIGWLGHFLEFIKYLAFFKVYRRFYSKIKTFSFFKTDFGIFFDNKHLATLASDRCVRRFFHSKREIFKLLLQARRSGLPGLAFSKPNKEIWPFLIGWPRNFSEFIKYLAFFKAYRSLVCTVKCKIFPSLKQRLAFSVTSTCWQPCRT